MPTPSLSFEQHGMRNAVVPHHSEEGVFCFLLADNITEMHSLQFADFFACGVLSLSTENGNEPEMSAWRDDLQSCGFGKPSLRD